MTRLLCALFRHPLITVNVHDRDPQTLRPVSIVGERCRCARRVESVKVYRGPYPVPRS